MGGHLRILCANLWKGRAHAESLADLVQETRADVVACQELGFPQAEAIGRVLPHGCLEPRAHYRGMGIGLRHPGHYQRISMPVRDAGVVRLDPADWPQLSQPVEIVNVHIAAPHVLRTQLLRWRTRQMRNLFRYLDAVPSSVRAVVGDFNATPGWPVYHRMIQRFEDVAVVHARRRNGRAAMTWPRWPGPRLLRLDHCFATGLVVEDFRVLDVPGSDHAAILVDFAVS